MHNIKIIIKTPSHPIPSQVKKKKEEKERKKGKERKHIGII